jgi:hypothetical protein
MWLPQIATFELNRARKKIKCKLNLSIFSQIKMRYSKTRINPQRKTLTFRLNK